MVGYRRVALRSDVTKEREHRCQQTKQRPSPIQLLKGLIVAQDDDP